MKESLLKKLTTKEKLVLYFNMRNRLEYIKQLKESINANERKNNYETKINI